MLVSQDGYDMGVNKEETVTTSFLESEVRFQSSLSHTCLGTCNNLSADKTRAHKTLDLPHYCLLPSICAQLLRIGDRQRDFPKN